MHPAHTPLARPPCQGCDCERHAAQPAARPADSKGLWRAMMNRWLPVDPAG